jgi:hypothetical protein
MSVAHHLKCRKWSPGRAFRWNETAPQAGLVRYPSCNIACPIVGEAARVRREPETSAQSEGTRVPLGLRELPVTFEVDIVDRTAPRASVFYGT